MSEDNVISRCMLEGFNQAITAAEKHIARNPDLLEEALAQSFEAISLDSSIQAKELKRYLNVAFYGKPDKDSHTLINILQHRLTSTKMLVSRFKAGTPATTTQEEVRDYYYSSQCWK